jgi:hypothetical protein
MKSLRSTGNRCAPQPYAGRPATREVVLLGQYGYCPGTGGFIGFDNCPHLQAGRMGPLLGEALFTSAMTDTPGAIIAAANERRPLGLTIADSPASGRERFRSSSLRRTVGSLWSR